MQRACTAKCTLASTKQMPLFPPSGCTSLTAHTQCAHARAPPLLTGPYLDSSASVFSSALETGAGRASVVGIAESVFLQQAPTRLQDKERDAKKTVANGDLKRFGMCVCGLARARDLRVLATAQLLLLLLRARHARLQVHSHCEY